MQQPSSVGTATAIEFEAKVMDVEPEGFADEIVRLGGRRVGTADPRGGSTSYWWGCAGEEAELTEGATNAVRDRFEGDRGAAILIAEGSSPRLVG
ncbi:hypothetical protein GCM10009745_69660 [Kribbella yunnanensis]|uniref:Uncharacterized protein n=1 Tax=Kribbella yunnanensis TaxID=190194 RepID=A0ABP4UWJ6_9ACTN